MRRAYATLSVQVLTWLGLHKVFVDDESYNSGHGHAFDTIVVDHKVVTVVIVRPDQCEFISITLPSSSLLAHISHRYLDHHPR